MYAGAVPNLVEQTKDGLLQTNLNYQKDLNEVAVIVAKNLAGREKEIGDGMAKDRRQRVRRAGIEGPGDLLQIPLGPKLLVGRSRGPSNSACAT